MKTIAAALLLASLAAQAEAPPQPVEVPLEFKVTVKPTSEQERARMRARHEAVMLQRGVPIYPRKYLKRDPQGCVNLGFDIGTDGKTSGIEVLNSAPAGLFDEVAKRSVAQSAFEPRPEPLHVNQVITFSIVPPVKGEEGDAIRDRLKQLCARPEAHGKP